MSAGVLMVEVREEGQVVNAYLHMNADEPKRILVASINNVLCTMHPELQEVFQDHVTKIATTIIESMGDQVDHVVKVPSDDFDGAAFSREQGYA